jgi:secondary thiamine-phosphate synthase enzyme
METAGRHGPALAARDDADLTAVRLSRITTVAPAVIATAELSVDTPGEGFLDITAQLRDFIIKTGAQDGSASLFLRHTSASLTVQENADPDVLRDLVSVLRHLAPRDFGWIHDAEGPDDMPAHVRTMLTGVSLQIPVIGGQLQLGTWQGVYVIEHRARPHRRQIVLQFTGSRR